jgi:DNA-binding SARP family transcriptional activator
MSVQFRMLGEVSAIANGNAVDLGPARRKCVLAVLLVSANHTVRLEQLVDSVWGDRPPQRAVETLRSYLSRLRTVLAALDGCRVRYHRGGYALEVREDTIDLYVFRKRLRQARVSPNDGDAAGLYEQALSMWHGDALADVQGAWAETMRRVLESERLGATMDYFDSQLRQGAHTLLLPRVEALAAAHPLDERLAGQLMLALYGNGRQADALDCYERLRVHLAGELGVDPSPDLQRMFQRILNGDATLLAPSSPPTVRSAHVPSQLPARPALFTGRSREVAALDRTLRTYTRVEQAAGVAAIVGGAGIGKTSLALHWAHEHADEFPDGQLFIDLHGFDSSDSPTSPGRAIRSFLHALGVSPAEVPADSDALAALYRSHVANKRMLIVLDNARDTAQVAPLLPGRSGCVVLVTSRHQLAGLVTGHSAEQLVLGALDPTDSYRALTRLIGADKVEAEPKAVAVLLDRCAGLPLALSILSARATTHSEHPLAALAAEIQDDATRLNTFDAGELSANLRSSFSLTCHNLSQAARRSFHFLGLHPGPLLTRQALASLICDTDATVGVVAGELTRLHLLTEYAPGHFEIHTLLHAYASEQAHAHHSEAELLVVRQRMLDHYVHTARAATSLLEPRRRLAPMPAPLPGVEPVTLTTRAQAQSWFIQDLPLLCSLFQCAVEQGFEIHAWQLAQAVTEFLGQNERWHNAVDICRAAERASEPEPDLIAQQQSHCGPSPPLPDSGAVGSRAIPNAYTNRSGEPGTA